VDTVTELVWPLPFGSPTYHQLADNLPLVSRTHSRPNAGWLARVANGRELFDALAPAWEQVWSRSGCDFVGRVTLQVEGERCCLDITPRRLRRLQPIPEGTAHVNLTPGVLAQLVFGFRPAAWAAGQLGQEIPMHVVPALTSLFPITSAWFAASNRC
jgi:hypothetical protein